MTPETVLALTLALGILAVLRLRKNLRDARAPVEYERPWKGLLASATRPGAAGEAAVRRILGPCGPCVRAAVDCPHSDPARLLQAGYVREDAGTADPLVFSVWRRSDGDGVVLSASERAPLRLGPGSS